MHHAPSGSPLCGGFSANLRIGVPRRPPNQRCRNCPLWAVLTGHYSHVPAVSCEPAQSGAASVKCSRHRCTLSQSPPPHTIRYHTYWLNLHACMHACIRTYVHALKPFNRPLSTSTATITWLRRLRLCAILDGRSPKTSTPPQPSMHQWVSRSEMWSQDAEKAAEKLHDALIVNGVRCKLLWGKPQAQSGAQQHMQPYPTAGGSAPAGAPGLEAPFGQPMYNPDGTPLPPPRLFGAQPASYPSMDPALMGAVPKGPPPGAGPGGAAPDGAAPAPMHAQPPLHMHGMPPPGAFPPGMPPPGQFRPPMGGMPPPGMPARPLMHAPPSGMGPPPPGAIMPPGAMPPVHPGAQIGFGMVARPRMGAGAGAGMAGAPAAGTTGRGGGPGPSGGAAGGPQDAPPGHEVQGAAA